ncbi:MAG: PAS domain S-box protein [Bacteroidetes bacterium]|nr:MAG: PAS domain S-box protein [Bacteroidota bacterium]
MSIIVVPLKVLKRVFKSRLTWFIIVSWLVFISLLMLISMDIIPFPESWVARNMLYFGILSSGIAAIILSRYNIFNYIEKIDTQNRLLKQRERMLTRINKKLLRQSNFLNLVTDSFSHPFIVVDAHNFEILMANKAFYEDHNLPDDFDIHKKKCFGISHHYDHPCNDKEHPCPVVEVKKTNKPATAIHTHKDFNGNDKIVEVNAFPVFDEATGKVKQIIEYNVDITQRIKEQKILAEKEERLRTIINTSPDAIAITQLDGTITFASEKSAQMMGMDKPAELIGKNVFDFLPPEDIEKARNTLRNLIHDNAPFERQEFKTIRKDGNVFFQETNASLLYDNQKQAFAAILITRDITDRKITEEHLLNLNQQLQEKSAQLRELNKSLEIKIKEEVETSREKDRMLILQSRQAAMGEMIGNIAHQWRQPLNTINLIIMDLLEAFNHGELDDAYLQHSYNEINKVVQGMSQTIDDFRNFFHPNKKKRVFDVNSIVEQSLSFTKPMLRAYHIETSFHKNGELYTTGYPNELLQTLINIFNNAKDALAHSDTKNKKINIKSYHTNNKAVIEILNNGNPISQENLEKIFDPYYSTKPEGQGTGLGLFISKTIIEKNMHGNLMATNTDNGVCFIIELQSTQN